MRFPSFVCAVGILVSAGAVRAGDAAGGPRVYVLSEHGDVSTEAKAQATLDRLTRQLIDRGGGAILVTSALPSGFTLHNMHRSKRNAPSVTVIDVRDGRLTMLPTPIGFDSRGAWSGHRIKRTLNLKGESLGHWTTVAASHIENNVVAGTISYGQKVLLPIKKGENARIYPASIEGLWVGGRINLSLGSARDPLVTIKSIGWDRDRRQYYFTADVRHDYPAGAALMNKHYTPGLLVRNHFNADNQTFELDSRTYQYGVGDSFCVSGTHYYQGNVFSGGGDEGAVCLNAETIHDLDSFRSEVESFDPKTGILVYRPGRTRTKKLSMSRPLINLNPKKWITAGHVRIVPQGQTYKGKLYKTGLLQGSKDAPWDASVVGRYFAVDEDSEKYLPGELPGGYWPAPRSHPVRRWYRITEFQRHPDGTKSIRFLRIFWYAYNSSAPTLFRRDNYTYEDKVRALKYIIAPGGHVYDISEGWVDTRRTGSHGLSLPTDPRRLKIATNGDRGTRFDFKPGDPIVQAVGPDPWMPRPLRVRMFDEFPSSMASPAIEITNDGFISRSDGLLFDGGPRYAEDLAKRKDRKPAYMNGVNLGIAIGTGIRFGGHVTEAALLMEQQAGNRQPIKWCRAPQRWLQTSLCAEPDDGRVTVTGGAVDLKESGLRNARLTGTPGISGTSKEAGNLRGISVPVPTRAKTLTVRFQRREPDSKYAVVVEPNWNTSDWTAKKTAEGFTVRFSKPSPKDATIDWQLLR